MVRATALALVVMVATPAIAAPWPLMEPYIAGPWETPGSTAAITRKGSTCLAKALKPGVTSAPTIISSDIEGGRIVANNAYEADGLLGRPMQSRSTVTFEAKDGRFRIIFSDVEEFIGSMGWQRVRVRNGPHDAPRQVFALSQIGTKVANCVRAPEDQW